MTLTPLKNSRRAFTLIELLTVIAIIGILAAMTLAISGYVATARREAKARGEIQLMSTKLEEFKTRYGEYPMPDSSSESDSEKALFNVLTGRWVYRTINGVRTWDKTLESGTGELRHPYLDGGAIGTDADPDNASSIPTKFVDPWGNAYRYRYGKMNTATGKADSTWDRPTFLIISAGAKFSAPNPENEGGTIPDSDFFQSNEATTGIVDVTTYFDDTYRKDNLTNFGPR